MLWHIFFSFLVLCLPVGCQSASSLVVNTPIGVINCMPTVLSWSAGGGPPYNILIESRDKLIAYKTSNTTTVGWNVNIPTNLLGEVFDIWVSDGEGGYGQSNNFTVAPGNCPSATTTTNKIASQSPITSQISALPGTTSTSIDERKVNQTQTSSTTASAQETNPALTGVQNAPTGVIIGGVIGGVLVLTIVIGSALWYQRKHNRPPLRTEDEDLGRP